MKQFVKISLCLLLVVGMLACFAACDISSILGGSQAGTYYLTKVESDGMSMSVKDMEALGFSAEDLKMYVQLNNDGTGVLSIFGEEEKISWGDGQIWPTDEPEDKVPLTFEGKTLIIGIDDEIMYFEK